MPLLLFEFEGSWRRLFLCSPPFCRWPCGRQEYYHSVHPNHVCFRFLILVLKNCMIEGSARILIVFWSLVRSGIRQKATWWCNLGIAEARLAAELIRRFQSYTILNKAALAGNVLTTVRLHWTSLGSLAFSRSFGSHASCLVA